MIEHLKRRMMTWVSVLLGWLVWFEASGMDVIAKLGEIVGQAEGAGMTLIGLAGVLAKTIQDYLNTQNPEDES